MSHYQSSDVSISQATAALQLRRRMSHTSLVATNRTSRSHISDYSASAKKQQCGPDETPNVLPFRVVYSEICCRFSTLQRVLMYPL